MFEEYVFRYGMHKGKNPSEVPTPYLQFLYEQASATVNACKEELEKRGAALTNHQNFHDYHKSLD